MKKSFLLLLAALLVLASLLWVKKYREGAPRRHGFVFDTTRATEIHSLRVQYRQDSTRLVTVSSPGESPRWLTVGDSFPVDTIRLRRVLGLLVGLQMREKVSDSADAQSLWDYGLNPEDAKRVQWIWGYGGSGDTVRIVLGKTSSLDYSFVYWKWQDRPEVYRTPGDFIWDVSPRAADWKEHRFWVPFTPADVRALAVDWVDSAGATRHYKVERTGPSTLRQAQGIPGSGSDSFRLTEPMVAPVLRSAGEKLFEKAPQFVADDFGLDLDTNALRAGEMLRSKPTIVIHIILKNGTTHTLKAGPNFEGLQYTQHPYHRNLVWVFKWRFDYFRKTPEQLMKGH